MVEARSDTSVQRKFKTVCSETFPLCESIVQRVEQFQATGSVKEMEEPQTAINLISNVRVACLVLTDKKWKP
jgi:hypothetical protein